MHPQLKAINAGSLVEDRTWSSNLGCSLNKVDAVLTRRAKETNTTVSNTVAECGVLYVCETRYVL